MFSHQLCETVQTNCHISDAHNAANYTLCVYLLKMREYFRWEKGYAFSDALPKEEVGTWVAERESLWEKLEHENFLALDIDGKKIDPFDTQSINQALLPKGYVYSGGIGLRATPHFFLGRLESKENYSGYTVLISADECARDLAAPPAMTLDNTIFVRRESVRRMIWEKVQEWQWYKHENAMAQAMKFYNFQQDIDEALEEMTENELEAVILHEIGEIIATQQLGEDWKKMMLSLPRSKAEIMVRAVKDLLADCLSTLPGLIENENLASLHFYCANLTAMRKELFPSFFDAYKAWSRTQDSRILKKLVAQGTHHWLKVANEIMLLNKADNESSLPAIESFITKNYL